MTNSATMTETTTSSSEKAGEPFTQQPTKTTRRRKSACTVQRFHYTPSRLFEQSLDIYRPTPSPEDGKVQPVLVILVVGSGWMGHWPIIYRLTSWWNSSGPRTVASQLGHTCVCIRHRSAFPHFTTLECIICLAMLLMASVHFLQDYYYLEEVFMLELFCVLITFTIFQMTSSSSATLEDMVTDVTTALTWVKSHQTTILDSTKQDPNQIPSNKPIITFGGYSSGAHVAATVLTKLKQQRQESCLGDPEEWIDQIVHISGVLAVSSTQSKTINGSDPPDTCHSNNSLDTSCQVFQDWIVQKAFRDQAGFVPSPLFQTAQLPKIPHLLIECQSEVVFSVLTPLLSIFFCSKHYADKIHLEGIPCSHYVLQYSNHWTILDSAELASALGEGIDAVIENKKTEHAGKN